MLDLNHINANVTKSEAIAKRLRDLGCEDRDVVGRLGVDLGDLYAGVERYKALIDRFLQMSPQDREQLGDVLADLSVELRHIDYHAKSSVGDVDALAEVFD
jgi:hypothetical protein